MAPRKHKVIQPLEEEDDTQPSLNAPFLKAQKLLRAYAINQDEMIYVLLLAILAREHAILIGPWGCNKTATANALLHLLNVSDGAFFKTLDKYTPPEELLGMFSTKALRERDEFTRNTKGKLPEARFAFIGEVFRGNGSVRVALHTIVNERYFENAGERVQVPLHTAFFDSNEFPSREEDQPFYDRILLRYNATYLPGNNKQPFLRMLKAKRFDTEAVSPIVSNGTIAAAYKAVQRITCGDEAHAALWDIRAALLAQNIELSDRRWVRSLGVLKAAAFLRGATRVDLPDFIALRHVLWRTPEDKAALATVLAPYMSATSLVSDEEHLKTAAEIVAMAQVDESKIPEALATLGEISDKLTGDEAKARISGLITDLETLVADL